MHGAERCIGKAGLAERHAGRIVDRFERPFDAEAEIGGTGFALSEHLALEVSEACPARRAPAVDPESELLICHVWMA